MSDLRQVVTVNGHRIELTHLDKVMYPETGTTKADVLSYYASVAPALIRHAANRPATRKRWVHGVGTTEDPGAAFFQKNLDEGAPDWLGRREIRHTDRVNVYPLVNDLATLTWLAQRGALEIHVPQWRFSPDGEAQNPDRLVLDLDPGPGVGLDECADIARFARRILQGMALEPVPVTSGSKGIHLYAPLDGTYTAQQVVLVTHELARALESDHPDRVVSGMSKALRPGKVFVDWSQNSAAKTTIAPYSLRGRARPTVAAPRTWAELDSPTLAQLELGQVIERLARDGDPLAVTVPSAERAIGVSAVGVGVVEPGTLQGGDPGSDRLAEYRRKRRADRTPKPVPAAAAGGTADRAGPDAVSLATSAASVADDAASSAGTSFVIHEHHARRLHWDLRFERDGVLVSWALPKGVPTDPARNHLAVHTEDHPLEYGAFEGTIAAGEYGAGQIVIWDHGEYHFEKWRDNEVIATLHGQPGGGLGAARRVALIHTGGGASVHDPASQKNWLIHLMKPSGTQATVSTYRPGPDEGVPTGMPEYVSPMLATRGGERDLGEDDWAFEMKWDGIRAIALVSAAGAAGAARLVTRNGYDVTPSYPEIVAGLAAALGGDAATAGRSGSSFVLDGEIVALDRSGRPNFGLLQTRMKLGAPEARAAALRVSVHYLLFDVLERNGRSLRDDSYDTRRRTLEGLLAAAPTAAAAARIEVPPALGGDYADALRTSRDLGLEGIVAKRRNAPYWSGRRSKSWIKVKHTRTQEVVVGGWSAGAGNRSDSIGALLLGIPGNDGLVFVGRVGTGFTERQLSETRTLLQPLQSSTCPFLTLPGRDSRGAHWVQPVFVGEVQFSEWTAAGRMRHLSWRGWRTDKKVTDVHFEPQNADPEAAPPDPTLPIAAGPGATGPG